jgi:hypothetical protein
MIDGAAAAVQRYPGESIGGPGGKAVKKTLGALAAVILALMLFSPPAEARCWWNGWRWQCHHRHHHYARHWHPYRSYAYYPYRAYYRPRYYAYACVWPFCW